MRFFRKLAGLLGFAKNEVKDEDEEEEKDDDADLNNKVEESNHPCKGFSVPVKVAVPVDRAQLAPIILPCNHGDGGVQYEKNSCQKIFVPVQPSCQLGTFKDTISARHSGFRWHAKRLRIDEDGDVADEFFDEVLPETLFKEDHKPSPSFQLKYSTRPAKVKNQVLSLHGQLQQCVEHEGRLQWG
ncbi:hypothetical protein LguiB_028572 [Lonicera macranthoides]